MNMRLVRVVIVVLIGVIIFIASTGLLTKPATIQEPNANSMSTMRTLSAVRGIPLPPLKEYPVEEVVRSWARRGIRLYLPTWAPEGYELRALAHKSGIGHIIFFVYSNTGDFSVQSGEIVIELSLLTTGLKDIREEWGDNPKVGYYTEINGWQAFVSTSLPVYWTQYAEKYGTTRSIGIDVLIDGVLYGFRFAPTITLQEAMKMVSSMQPAA